MHSIEYTYHRITYIKIVLHSLPCILMCAAFQSLQVRTGTTESRFSKRQSQVFDERKQKILQNRRPAIKTYVVTVHKTLSVMAVDMVKRVSLLKSSLDHATYSVCILYLSFRENRVWGEGSGGGGCREISGNFYT